MLMHHAGTRMRELVAIVASLDRWHPVLDSVARISLALEDDVGALLSIGVRDLRLATFPASFAALMEEIKPRLPSAPQRTARGACCTSGVTWAPRPDLSADVTCWLPQASSG